VHIVGRPGVPNHALEMSANAIESDLSSMNRLSGRLAGRTYGSLSMS
jgi:hypothetical protein